MTNAYLQLPEIDINENYQLLAKIGSGGMGDVFLAIQRGAGDFSRLVVIKRIHERQLQYTAEYARMFVNEARVVASLNHPHIVKVYDFCMTGPSVCIVMEYIEGETLKYIFSSCKKRNEPIPLPLVSRLILDACDTLAYAHNSTTLTGESRSIVHRDIGLHNMMLDNNGYLKIIDFGIAKSSFQTDKTCPGLIKGNPGYMAPDVFNQADPDHRIDIYALGLCLHELITHRRAFVFDAKATVGQIIHELGTRELPLPSQLVPDLPVGMDDVVLKAIDKDRTRRYQTAEAMSNDLKRVVGQKLMTGAEVKEWFVTHFDERVEERRAFGAKMLELAKSSANVKKGTPNFPSHVPAAFYSRVSFTPSGRQRKPPPPPRQPLRSHSPRPAAPGSHLIIEKRNLYKMVAAVFLFFFLLTGLVYFAIFRNLAPSAPPAPVDNLVVTCNPIGSKLSVDGKELGLLGKDALAMRVEPNKPHEIILSKQGYRDFALPFIGPAVGAKQIHATLIRIENKGTQPAPSLSRTNKLISDEQTNPHRNDIALKK